MPSLKSYRCSLGLACALVCAPAPAVASVPVTTGVTDSGGEPLYTLVIVDPQDGAVIPGSPDAVVPVTIEYTGIGESYVGLMVDDMDVGTCADKPSPCTLDVTLTAGSHTLVATGQVFADEPEAHSPPVTIEVKEGVDTDTTTGDDPTSGTASTSGTGDDGSSGASGSTSGGGGTDDKGCACASSRTTPDLLGLALLLLLVPRRRRRII